MEGEIRGITPELYQAIVAVIDHRMQEIKVTRQDFDELKKEMYQAVGRLDRALAELAEAQKETRQGLKELAEAQKRTELRVEELAEAQKRTELRVEELAEAQKETRQEVGRLDKALAELAEAQARTEKAVQRLTRQVGGLSETVGGDIEDIAYIVIHDVLEREYGWQVGVLERTWQKWDGKAEEVNIFGQAVDPRRPDEKIWIVGEAKHNLSLREVDRFARQVERARQHLKGEVFPICFCYRARPEVRERIRELGLRLVFSYGRMI